MPLLNDSLDDRCGDSGGQRLHHGRPIGQQHDQPHRYVDAATMMRGGATGMPIKAFRVALQLRHRGRRKPRDLHCLREQARHEAGG